MNLEQIILDLLREQKQLPVQSIVDEVRERDSTLTNRQAGDCLYQLARSGRVFVTADFASIERPESCAVDERTLHVAITKWAERARQECGCGFDELLARAGEVELFDAIDEVLNAEALSDDFLQLWSRGRLDLTLESFLLTSP